MSSEPSTFRCMRCGHEFVQTWGDRDERMCPKCRSNSVRKLKGKPKPTK